MRYPDARCSMYCCNEPAVQEVIEPLGGGHVSMKWLCAEHAEPVLTEQPALIPGMYSECILEQRPLFEGGMDRSPRRKPDNPEQRRLFE